MNLLPRGYKWATMSLVDIQNADPPGRKAGHKAVDLLCKRITVAKFEDVKTRWSNLRHHNKLHNQEQTNLPESSKKDRGSIKTCNDDECLG